MKNRDAAGICELFKSKWLPKKIKVIMPVKIGFQVVACSSEDEKFRATELNYHGPTARGWRSSYNCSFPQEIILQLKVLAILQQIQILAHQYLIPHKIEICTSSKLDHEAFRNNTRDVFEYLGFITFSDNKTTGFRSRELKSILIPSKKAKYIKLRIHKNHENIKNVQNQVSLIAVNILGNELHSRTEETEMNNNGFLSNSLYASSISYNANYLSPYDDLAFQMSVDEETAKIIKIIECKMLQALVEDRLDYANALKITIENLKAAGEILGIYEQEKKKAINLEDFDKAKWKKIQIDNFRERIYNTLSIDKLLEETDGVDEYDLNSNPEEKPIQSNEDTPNENSPNGNHDNVQSYEYEEYSSPSKVCRPPKQLPPFSNQLTHSQSQTFQDSSPFFPPPTFSTSISNPQLYQYLKQTHSTIPESCHELEYKLDASLEHVRTPSSESDSLSGDDPSPPKSPTEPRPKWNSMIPRFDCKARPDTLAVNRSLKDSKSPPSDDFRYRNRGSGNESKAKNKPKSSFEAYEDRMLPALRSYHGNEVVRECQLAFDQQRKSTLNEREKKQAMLPIAVFGIEMIEKFYSKSFNDKEEGLRELQQELKRLVTTPDENKEGKLSYNKVARATVFLLHRGLRDTVFSVYKLAAETVRMFFAEFVPQRTSPSEVVRCVEKLLPELLTKSGDVTPRIHNLAAHTLLSMAECEEVRRLNLIPTHLSRPITSSVHPRLALSRLEMVEQLILNHGISKDKKSGLTCRTLAEFGSSGLHHPAEAVRKVSERILIHVYKVNPRIVRKQLPPDDNVTRRNLLYRQLFQEFDFMDVQRRLNEQSMEDSLTTYDNSQFSSLQPETQTHDFSVKEEIKDKVKVNQEPTKIHNLKQKSPTKRSISETRIKKPTVTPNNHPKPYNGDDTLKFPSLTDSIKTTKARMNQHLKTPQNGTSSLPKKEIKRASGIPIPTTRNINKQPIKRPERENPTKLPKPIEVKPKQKTVNKTIKIRMFDSIEDNKIAEEREDENKMIESIKFSDSMLASIRENDLTMSGLFNGRDEGEEKLKTCIFCLSSKKWTTEDSLNRHYLRDCMMLTTCEYCMEVTEISGFTNHLLDDCKWKNIFQKCVNCKEAILSDLYDKHECTASGGKVPKTRCPFCHKTIGDGESSWRKHLMGKNTCPNHPRQK